MQAGRILGPTECEETRAEPARSDVENSSGKAPSHRESDERGHEAEERQAQLANSTVVVGGGSFGALRLRGTGVLHGAGVVTLHARIVRDERKSSRVVAVCPFVRAQRVHREDGEDHREKGHEQQRSASLLARDHASRP